jgi:hypothetical protein
MIGRGEEVENWETARAVLAVNLDGALATVAGVLPEMRRPWGLIGAARHPRRLAGSPP